MARTYLPGWLSEFLDDPKFVPEPQLKQEAQAQRDEDLRQKLVTMMRAKLTPPVNAVQDIAPRTPVPMPPPPPPPLDQPPGPGPLPPIGDAPQMPPTPVTPGSPPPINDYWA